MRALADKRARRMGAKEKNGMTTRALRQQPPLVCVSDRLNMPICSQIRTLCLANRKASKPSVGLDRGSAWIGRRRPKLRLSVVESKGGRRRLAAGRGARKAASKTSFSALAFRFPHPRPAILQTGERSNWSSSSSSGSNSNSNSDWNSN